MATNEWKLLPSTSLCVLRVHSTQVIQMAQSTVSARSGEPRAAYWPTFRPLEISEARAALEGPPFTK